MVVESRRVVACFSEKTFIVCYDAVSKVCPGVTDQHLLMFLTLTFPVNAAFGIDIIHGTFVYYIYAFGCWSFLFLF